MSNQVDTIKNTISDSHSISDLQNIIDFCTNPANKDFLFVEFSPYSRPSDLSFFEGERDVLDFQAAIAILDRLDEFKEPNGSILFKFRQNHGFPIRSIVNMANKMRSPVSLVDVGEWSGLPLDHFLFKQ